MYYLAYINIQQLFKVAKTYSKIERMYLPNFAKNCKANLKSNCLNYLLSKFPEIGAQDRRIYDDRSVLSVTQRFRQGRTYR